jgi:succinate dehydrogenase / fumarate reductase membrane anchor subunit
MTTERTRSPLARAAGLGSAKAGVEHWWRQRLSAVALVPLTVWFVAAIITHRTSDYAIAIAWLKTPFATFMMVLLLVALFHHVALGLQVIIEDYVHSAAKIPALIVMRLACFGTAAAGILAVAHIALGH